MALFLLRRFAAFLLTLWATSAVVFIALEILPGDPALTILGVDAPPSAVAALHEKLGLDRPALERYLRWLGGLAAGDLGLSYTYATPVSELIADRLALTVPLALLAMAMAVAAALALGLFAAARQNRPGDWAVMAFSQVGVAVPSFWFGILLILLFSVQLKWFKSGGFPGWGDPWEALRALALPAFALALFQAAVLARVTRGAVLDAMREDWVRTARAKGLSAGATLRRHVLRNAMIPVATVMGLQFANLLAGAVVIENVFALPGLGRLIFQAISNRDLIVVENATLLLAAMVVAVNFAVDLLYAAIDPRVKAQA